MELPQIAKGRSVDVPRSLASPASDRFCVWGHRHACISTEQDDRGSADDCRPHHVPDHVRGLATPQRRDRLDDVNGGAADEGGHDNGRGPSQREHPEEGSRNEEEGVQHRLRRVQRQTWLDGARPPPPVKLCLAVEWNLGSRLLIRVPDAPLGDRCRLVSEWNGDLGGSNLAGD